MSNCINGYKVSIVLEVVIVNGSTFLVPMKNWTPCPLDPGPIVAAAFLTLLFVGAILMSLMVIVTISTSFTLKKYLYSHLLVNICSIIIFDCLLNITIAIVYVTTAPWQFGYHFCYFNSFSMIFLTFEMSFGVLLFALDRFFVAKKIAPYLSLSTNKLTALVLLTWICSLAGSIPAMVLFESMPYLNRYSCSLADELDDIYLIAPFLLALVVPTVVMIIVVSLTAYIFHKERKKQKRVRGGQTFTYLDQILMTPYYRNEVYPYICMVSILGAYLLLWLPFGTVITLDPILSKDWFNKTLVEFKDNSLPQDQTDKSISPDGTMSVNGTTLSSDEISAMNDTTPDYLIPEMTGTPAYETVFVWFRFIFDFLVPILIFVTVRDVRLKCENLIFCCRPSSVDVSSPKQVAHPYPNKTPKSSGFTDLKQVNRKPKSDNKNMVSFKTPVLFATAEGLHIRTVEDTYLDMLDPKPLLGFAKGNNNEPKFSYEVCDIVLPNEDLADFEGQYDLDDDVGGGKNDYQISNEVQEEKSFNDSVMNGANAALMARQIEINGETDETKVNKHGDERPNTAARKEIERINKERKDLEEKFDETIELDLNKPAKVKKHVRFNTNNMIQTIPRPSSADSENLDDSFTSTNSTDSGIFADNEVNHYDQYTDKRPINKNSKPSRVEISKPKVKPPKRVVHNIRHPPASYQNKRNIANGKIGRAKKKPSRNQVVPQGAGRDGSNGVETKRSSGVPQIHKIKSRYMNHYTPGNGSASSVTSNDRNVAGS